jgi:hypothetical protein
MRRLFQFTAAVAIMSGAVMFAPSAGAMMAVSATGVQQGQARIDTVEQVVRVCRHRFFTSRRVCWVDRSRPPTVCHHIRGSSRRDCY